MEQDNAPVLESIKLDMQTGETIALSTCSVVLFDLCSQPQNKYKIACNVRDRLWRDRY